MRILLLEDDVSCNALARAILAGEGHALDAAFTALDALRLADAAPYDLMVADLGLPDMDGAELIMRVRGRHPDLPILVCSAHVDDRTQARAFAAGASGYLAKPYRRRHLLSALGGMMGGDELPA